MKMIHLLLITALTGFGGVASAQWQWIDKDGHKVFSDRAPPTEIPDKNILKRPGSRAPIVPVSDTAEANEAAASAPLAVKPPAGLDKELEAKKKKAQDADAAKRKAVEEENTKARIENCARAKAAKTTFESGVRIDRTNAAGEREIMNDAVRAEELKRILGIISRDCR